MQIHQNPDTLSFLGVPSEYETSRVVVLSVPYEGTVSYGKGTGSGPAAILNASNQVELFDEEFGDEPISRIPVCTLDPIAVQKDAESLNEDLARIAKGHIDNKKWVLTLGGEHSITPGLVRAHADRWPGLGVLQIDAHSDLRDSYQGNKYSHASAMARSIEYAPVTGVGIRSSCLEENALLKSDRYTLFSARETNIERDIEKIIASLPEHVYLTFDVDGLDPSIMPGTGTPEPGGLFWYETLFLIKSVAEKRSLVGADIVEVAPLGETEISEFTAARLAYKILSYAAAAGADSL